MPWMPGESLCIRLWDSIERFIVGAASPYQLRREAKARAEARRIEALLDAETARHVEAVRAGQAVPPAFLLPRQDGHARLTSAEDSARREPTLLPVAKSAADLERIADLRCRIDAIEKMMNLRAVHRFAEEAIEQDFADREAPEEKPSVDWISAWRNGAEATQEEEMQRLWARLICEEIGTPGAFSKRTIETLKTLSAK